MVRFPRLPREPKGLGSARSDRVLYFLSIFPARSADGGRYRQAFYPHERAHPGARDSRDRGRRRTDWRDASLRGAQNGPRKKSRPGGNFPDRATSGLPHHGLREISVPERKARARSQEKAEDHYGQGSEVSYQRGRSRLRNQEESRAAVPRRRRQGESDHLLPGTRNDSAKLGPEDSGTADQGRRPARFGGVPSAAGRQHAAPDSGAQQEGRRGERKAAGSSETRTSSRVARRSADSVTAISHQYNLLVRSLRADGILCCITLKALTES